VDLELLREFIRSRLQKLDGAYLAIAMKTVGTTTRITFYDPYELADKVEGGEKDATIPIVAKVVISDFDINHIDAKPEYKDIIEKIVEDIKRKNSGEYMQLIRNHYTMINYLKNNGRNTLAATLTYAIA